MSGQIKSLINTIPIASAFWIEGSVRAGRRQDRQAYRDVYTGILEDAEKAAVDPTLGLILVHLPVPHPPGVYDRDKAAFEVDGESSYLDNLALADKAMGDVRSAMEAAGMWDDTVVLATSDHWWRCDIWGKN